MPRPHALSIALLLPLSAVADPATLDEVQAERRLERLGITPAQAAAIAPVLDEVAALQLERCTITAERGAEAMEAWGELRDIVAVDGPPDPAVFRAARDLEQELRLQQEATAQVMQALEDEVSELLEPAQRSRLEALPPGVDPAVERALREAADRRHPRVGRLGRALQQPAIALALYELAGEEPSSTHHQAVAMCASVEEERAQLQRLRAEISSWNLLNGLHLGLEQALSLQAAASLAPPENEDAAEDALDPAQLELLRGFSPCLLPPKDLSEPIRAGQADGGGAYERWLERARQLGPQGRDLAIQALLERERQNFGSLPLGREAEVADVLARASAMDELAYALEEPALLEALTLDDELHELRLAHFDSLRAEGQQGVVGHFLLSEAFQDVLVQRFGEGG